VCIKERERLAGWGVVEAATCHKSTRVHACVHVCVCVCVCVCVRTIYSSEQSDTSMSDTFQEANGARGE